MASVKMAVGGLAPVASASISSADEMRAASKSMTDWKQKQQEAKKNGTKCANGSCTSTVGQGGVTSLQVEHVFPAGRIWAIGKDKLTVGQMRRLFTDPSNLILLCQRCNGSKGGKTYPQFAASGGMSTQQAAQLQAQANAFHQNLLNMCR